MNIKERNDGKTTAREAFEEPIVEIIEFESVSADIYTSGFGGEFDEEI